MSNDVSVHWFCWQISYGILGGPAFNLWTASEQDGVTDLTIGLCLNPSYSSAYTLSYELVISLKIYLNFKSSSI